MMGGAQAPNGGYIQTFVASGHPFLRCRITIIMRKSTSMFRKIKKKEADRIDPKTKFTHPNAIVKATVRLINDIGAEKFLHGAGYNQQREMFLASMFTYAIRGYTGNEVFLHPGDDPPDVALVIPTERSFHDRPFDYAMVEIVEIPQKFETETDLLKSVTSLIKEKKIDGYKPAKGTMLLIFLNLNHGGALIGQLESWKQENPLLFEQYGEAFVIWIRPNSGESLKYSVKSLDKRWVLEQSIYDEFNKKGVSHPMLIKQGVIIETDEL